VTIENKKVPQIIKNIGFDFHWSEEKVWQLKIATEIIDIKDLAWHFDIPFLWYKGGIYNLTPSEVMSNPQKYKSEYQRMMKADFKYPIDIMKNKGRWLILDGLHRLMKARVTGLQTVQVRKIPRTLITKITK
jgi:hypothetical protein